MRDLSKTFDEGICRTPEGHPALVQLRSVFERIATAMSRAILSGNKILWCGNGGSAADSQHLAAELVGRILSERRGLPSIALTTNTSILTAIGNDYGYEHVFPAANRGALRRGDVRRRHLDIGKQQECLPGTGGGRRRWELIR